MEACRRAVTEGNMQIAGQQIAPTVVPDTESMQSVCVRHYLGGAPLKMLTGRGSMPRTSGHKVTKTS